jgi:hypothetical protein
MPSRSAATNPPCSRSAKEPIDEGIGQARLMRDFGSKRLSDGPLMSTQ